MTPEFLANIPTNEELATRFEFIDNEKLKENITIYFRYIVFLLALSEDENAESLSYTLYKDIIIFTASIVESLLDYTVRREVLHGNAKKNVFGYSKKTEHIGKIKHECDDLYEAHLQVIKVKKGLKIESSDEITFNDIIKAAKNAGILDDKLYLAADELRKKRNTIHITSLTKSSDDYFKKKDVETAFKNAHDIILSVEKLFK